MAQPKVSNQENRSPCSGQYESCACSEDPEPCSCRPDSCGGQIKLEECAVSKNDGLIENGGSKNPIHWLLRAHEHKKVENDIASGLRNKKDWALGGWGIVDKALLGGIFVSILMIFAAIMHLEYRTLVSKRISSF